MLAVKAHLPPGLGLALLLPRCAGPYAARWVRVPWALAGILGEAPFFLPLVPCPCLSAPRHLGTKVTDGLRDGSSVLSFQSLQNIPRFQALRFPSNE